LKLLELPLSEKQLPQVVEKLESGGKSIEALELTALRPRSFKGFKRNVGFPECASGKASAAGATGHRVMEIHRDRTLCLRLSE
jgi:hypothetical protein